MSSPLISVIVPVYNVELYLPKCVDSILAQTYQNLEIILVEDGTKDRSGEICDAYAAKDPRIKVIHKENGGLSSARNAGMDVARGEYFGFVDSDDWIEPETYETLMELARKYDADLVCGGRYDVDGATGERTIGLCPQKEECISAMEMLGRVFIWDNCDSAAWDKLYRRHLFDEIRYPLGMVSEDIAIFYKLMEKANRVALCPKPLYNYLHRENSITTAKLSEKTFHYPGHTEVIYPYICQYHPEVKQQARFLRVRGIAYAMMSIDLAGREAWQQYADYYARMKKEMQSHVGFLLTSPYHGKKERLVHLLLAAGLYRHLKK